MPLRRLLRYHLPAAILLAVVPVSLWYGLAARFAPDDAMNLGQALRDGWGRLLRSQIDFLHSAYRPLGGLFYLAIYKTFGLNPLPYRMVLHAVLAANVLLSYRTALLLSRSHTAAAITAIAAGYHAALFNLHFETSVVYDILSTFFYLLALRLYLAPRMRLEPIGLPRLLAIAACYVAALNAKEIAVSLPVMLVLFELVMHRRLPARAALATALLAALTALFVWGRLHGPGAIGQMNGYVPVLTWNGWVEARAHQASELLYRSQSFGPRGLAGFAAAVLLIAWSSHRRWVWWAVAFWLVSALPIDFIRPLRGGANLYLPLFGYALLLAAVLTTVTRRIVPSPRLRTAMLALLCLLYIGKLYHSRAQQGPAWMTSQQQTWNYIEQMRAIGGIRPGESIVFLNDPFEVWDMYFLAQIVIGDPSPNITLQRMLPKPLTEAELAAFQHVLTFENGRLRRVR